MERGHKIIFANTKITARTIATLITIAKIDITVETTKNRNQSNTSPIIAEGTPSQLRNKFTHNVQISFGVDDKMDLTSLNCDVQNLDSKIIINTPEPTKILHKLTTLALGSDIELVGLEVKRPTLEDVFLKLSEK